MHKIITILLIAFLAFAFSGCTPPAPVVVPPAGSTQQAQVSGVEVLQLVGSPQQVRVEVKGSLPDSCFQLQPEAVAYAGNIFAIILPAAKQPGMSCTAQPVPYQRVIPLDTANLPGGEYLVIVNDLRASFTLAGSGTATPAIPATGPTIQPSPSLSSSSPAPTVPPPAATAAPAASTCADQVVFVDDVTVPDFSTLSGGSGFVKTWKVQNAGSCPWVSGYVLSFLSGAQMGGPASLPLPAANPGDTVDISLNLTAPAAQGGYTSNWTFLNSKGERIPIQDSEPYIWLKVNIAGPTPLPSATTSPSNPVTGGPTASPTSPYLACISVSDTDFANQVVALINQERTSRQLPALKLDPKLSAAALDHSMDMSCNNFVEHYGTDGSTWFTRITARSYHYSYASENIAAGKPASGGDPAWVVQTNWMHSQVHRDNILNPNVTQIGVAYTFNSNAKWGGYTTVDFAMP